MPRHVPTQYELTRRWIKVAQNRLLGCTTRAEPSTVEHISIELAAAVHRLQFGGVTTDDLLNLQDAVNVCIKLVTSTNYPQALLHLRAAENALVLIDERKTSTGRWGANSRELDAIKEFLPYHDAMLGSAPVNEIEDATDAVKHELKAAA